MLTITHTYRCEYCDETTSEGHRHYPFGPVTQPLPTPEGWSFVNGNHICPKHRVKVVSETETDA